MFTKLKTESSDSELKKVYAPIENKLAKLKFWLASPKDQSAGLYSSFCN